MQKIHRFLFAIPALSSIVLSLGPIPIAVKLSSANEPFRWPTEFAAPDLSDRGRPDGRSRGGASRRGGCELPEGESPLTALVPSAFIEENTFQNPTENSSSDTGTDVDEFLTEVVFSLTTRAHPEFWFYVPYSLDGDLTLEFVLQDLEGSTLYQTRIAPEADSPGIFSITLPESSPALMTATPYQWFFVAYCDTNSPMFVEGWIERIELNTVSQEQLEQFTPTQRATVYTEQGIWQDALMTLGDAYLDNPESADLATDWFILLQSAGLEDIAAEKILFFTGI